MNRTTIYLLLAVSLISVWLGVVARLGSAARGHDNDLSQALSYACATGYRFP